MSSTVVTRDSVPSEAEALPWPRESVARVRYRLDALGVDALAGSDYLARQAALEVRDVERYTRRMSDADLVAGAAEAHRLAEAEVGWQPRRGDLLRVRSRPSMARTPRLSSGEAVVGVGANGHA
ncbi:hypothetical protein [Intrasporangium sp.]|uniref:hypothetical protein n=1 Tax=Intrasporangium sp. TaxID=1925024 RepID=UPI0032221032